MNGILSARACGLSGLYRWLVTLTSTTTRLHSSRMHTARVMTISPSMLCGRGVPAPRGRACSWGVPAPGRILLGGGCLLWCLLLRGWGGIPAFTEADPPSEQNHTRLWKTQPGPNFVAGGKNQIHLNFLQLEMVGMLKHFSRPSCSLAPLVTCVASETFTTYYFHTEWSTIRRMLASKAHWSLSNPYRSEQTLFNLHSVVWTKKKPYRQFTNKPPIIGSLQHFPAPFRCGQLFSLSHINMIDGALILEIMIESTPSSVSMMVYLWEIASHWIFDLCVTLYPSNVFWTHVQCGTPPGLQKRALWHQFVLPLKLHAISLIQLKSLLPGNEVCEGYVFTRVCLYTGGSTWAGTPEQVHPLGRYPSGRYTPSPRAVQAGRYGQQAGGTHSTGMHSCLSIEFQMIFFIQL